MGLKPCILYGGRRCYDGDMSADPHQPLRDDVRLLGEQLGRVLRQHEGESLFNRVEQVRTAAKRARGSDAEHELEAVAALLQEMPIDSALTVARAFAHFLHLANIAEQHHRERRRRDYARDPEGHPQPGSCAETFARLREAGVPADALVHAIESMRIELVLTAHPTEIARRTLIQKHIRIAELLAFRDRPDLTPAEQDDSLDALYREISAAWQTDEIRRERLTPLDEVRAGLVIFEQTLWDALPQYLRAVDRALVATTGRRLSIETAPLRFGSWIGGDRDGNPNVTPEVTRQATWLARWQGADLYLREIVALRAELSVTIASEELRDQVGQVREPYRALLAQVRDRLAATRAWAEASLRDPHAPASDRQPYTETADFAAPLQLCLRSLESTGNGAIASGRLTDILRRIAAFGLTLARLDLRQEASRHTEAVDWIARVAGLGSYSALPEDERQALLVRELTSLRLVLDSLPLEDADERVRDVLETLRVASRLHPESLGAYVITMAGAPSDVLAVEFLQSLTGNRRPQRVVPLFETAADLHRAGSVMAELLTIPWYRQRIHGEQEVMIGYSDSAKDAGRFSAAWSLYRAQEQVVAACETNGVALTLFHGRGGSIGRGGGPTYVAIQSQPPGSIRGRLRVTEQGEMLQAKFGLRDIAIRTLEVYTTATLESTVAPRSAPAAEWREWIEEFAARARAGYRSIVYDNPQFLPYFRSATPEPELSSINIGSRPARRKPDDGLGSLRAIPWQFAWTQTRLLLPSWLGVEDAFEEALRRGRRDALHTMYREWPFFTSTIDLIEMTLAKADARIAAQYDRLVPSELRQLGMELRARLAAARDAVLTVTRHQELLETNPVLRRSIDVRNPYVDPINLVQVALLRRLRAPGADPRLHDAFVVTVNGIAAGMRNTG
jgi:phosphoenolpyruvate carboxylase